MWVLFAVRGPLATAPGEERLADQAALARLDLAEPMQLMEDVAPEPLSRSASAVAATTQGRAWATLPSCSRAPVC
jgi:hypothetical protein